LTNAVEGGDRFDEGTVSSVEVEVRAARVRPMKQAKNGVEPFGVENRGGNVSTISRVEGIFAVGGDEDCVVAIGVKIFKFCAMGVHDSFHAKGVESLLYGGEDKVEWFAERDNVRSTQAQ
jgi:hypothetical protein